MKDRLSELLLPLEKYKKQDLAREILLGVILGLLGMFLVIGLQELGTWVIRLVYSVDIEAIFSSSTYSQFEVDIPRNFWDLLWFILTMLLFVGIPEEIMFRGFVQRSFESKMKKPAATLLTALYFALFHIYIYILVPPIFLFLIISYIGLSIFLGLIRNWRKDIVAASAMHIVYNITQTVIFYIILS